MSCWLSGLCSLVNGFPGARLWKSLMKLSPRGRDLPFQLARRTRQRQCKRREEDSVKGVLEKRQRPDWHTMKVYWKSGMMWKWNRGARRRKKREWSGWSRLERVASCELAGLSCCARPADAPWPPSLWTSRFEGPTMLFRPVASSSIQLQRLQAQSADSPIPSIYREGLFVCPGAGTSTLPFDSKSTKLPTIAVLSCPASSQETPITMAVKQSTLISLPSASPSESPSRPSSHLSP